MCPSRPILHRRKVGALTWLLRDDVPAPVRILQDPDSQLVDPTRIIKCSDIVTIGRVEGFIVRRLNYRTWRHRWRDVFRRSRAKSAMLSGLALEAAGVPTARAVAVAERRFLRWPLGAFLLTEELTAAVSLEYLLRTRRPPPRIAEKKLAATLARLHEAGFSHRDLKPSNVLINEAYEAALIDLDAIRPLHLFKALRVADDLIRLRRGLMHLPLHPRTLARFFVHYSAARGLTSPKRLWRRVVRAFNP